MFVINIKFLIYFDALCLFIAQKSAALCGERCVSELIFCNDLDENLISIYLSQKSQQPVRANFLMVKKNHQLHPSEFFYFFKCLDFLPLF
jgi:catechol-2,3-dioxygenase